jgi:hypothetical protein
MAEEEGFRLIVVHRGCLLTDEVCRTTNEAKRRFLDLYGFRAFKADKKPEWSYLYPPDPEWLKGWLRIPDST